MSPARDRLILTLVLAAGLLAFAGHARAADPGTVLPDTAEAGALRRGSVLFFNLYTSGPDPSAQDTRLALTNTGAAPAIVRLFLVDGTDRTATSSAVCLTAHQTVSLAASSLRAGRTGYAVAIAIDGNGCPVAHNFLVGQAHPRFPSGFRGSLEAVAIPAVAPPPCAGPPPTVTVAFDGAAYARVPRALALTQIGSRADDIVTLLVLNRVGGDLSLRADALGDVSGVLFDDAENQRQYNFESAGSQIVAELTDSFPVTAPPLEASIPAGRTGWTRIASLVEDAGLLGAAMIFRAQGVEKVPGARVGAGRQLALGELAVTEFAGAANLRVLSVTSAPSYVVPVLGASC